jgi:hypothetical protein
MKVIGIDGGATKVSGCVIEKLDHKTYTLAHPVVDIKYSDHQNFNPEFLPQPIDVQHNNEDVIAVEKRQGTVYVETVLKVVQLLAENEQFQVAIAMPGLKTNDGRGIRIMANGPRIPYFCDQIQKTLNLEHPIQRLESDADMCVWGEEYAENGAIRSVKNAYYLGGGTGTADGLKIKGNLIPFDDASNWIAKSIELKMSDGQSLETYASMSGINTLRQSITDSEIGTVLGALIFERISTIYSGWKNPFSLSRKLQTDHPFQNTFLDRIVIGQRLSEFLQSEDGESIRHAMMDSLKKECSNTDIAISNYYLIDCEFDRKRIFMSNLRAAPIIGLGAKVWITQC